MKPRALAAGMLTLAAVLSSTASAESAPKRSGVRINLDEPAQAKPAPTASEAEAAKTTPAPAPAATSATPQKEAAKGTEKKKDASQPAIAGMEVSRGERGLLGVKIENGTFKISFYNSSKEPVAADVSRVVLRWSVNYQPNDERAFLQPTEDRKAMTSEKVVRAPYAFKLYITLLNDEAEEGSVAENYVIDFRQ